MGFDAMMIGVDSDYYEDFKEIITALLAAVSSVNGEAKTFKLGSLNDNSYFASLGGRGGLHALRTYAVHLELTGRPPEKYEEIGDLLRQVYDGKKAIKRFRHLVEHADDGGYYVPVDFSDPLAAGKGVDSQSPIGSSQRLLAELDEINASFKLKGDYGQPGEEDFIQSIEGDPWQSAKEFWGALHWYARESINHKLIIGFS